MKCEMIIVNFLRFIRVAEEVKFIDWKDSQVHLQSVFTHLERLVVLHVGNIFALLGFIIIIIFLSQAVLFNVCIV